MIRCDKTKTIIFLNPKTGTESLVETFKQIPGVKTEHVHRYPYDFKSLQRKYSCYAFGRNPIDRYYSCLIYSKRGPGFIEWFLNYFYNLDYKLYTFKDYYSLPPELKEKIEKISLEEIMYSNYCKDKNVWIDQKSFLNYNWISIKNFYNFDDEVKSILKRFNLNTEIEIKKCNQTIKLPTDKLSKEIVKHAQKLYADDFEILDKANIKWSI